mgnify:CR=1 FL=1
MMPSDPLWSSLAWADPIDVDKLRRYLAVGTSLDPNMVMAAGSFNPLQQIQVD